MRNKFDRELQKLHNDLVEMGKFIGAAIGKTMSAFKTNDYALAKEVRENDDIADELEFKIERRSLRILLSQQPVARDLRTISTALKMIIDMERISDQARNIAVIVLRFEGKELAKKPENLLLMSERCVEMVNKSVEAFINNDLDLAKAVIAMDDEVDTLYHGIYDNVTTIVAQNPDSVKQVVDMVMMAKFLERISDHAVNIAEWVMFNITGEHKSKVLL